MKKIIFSLGAYGYTKNETSEPKSWIVKNFLSSDVRDGAQDWIELLRDDEARYASSNVTFLQKVDSKVYLTDLFDEHDSNIEEPEEFAIPKERLIYLLEKWGEFFKKRVPKIILTFDDDYNFIDIYAEE